MSVTFSFDRDTLFPILSSLQPLCTRRTTVEATSNLLLRISNKELVIKATDLEISIQASCELIDSNALTPQNILIPGRRFFEVVRELEGAITCTFEENQLSITTDSIELRLNVRDSEEFPPFPERIENLLSFEKRDLIGLLDSVAFLIPQNNSNPALNGLLIEVDNTATSFTSTDGHRLAQAKTTKYSLEETKTWLLPRRAAFELKKILDTVADEVLFLGTCDSHFVISSTQFNFFTRLIAQPFPEYRPILSSAGFDECRLAKTQFVKALKRSTSLLSGQFIASNFFIKQNAITLVFSNKGVGTLQEEVTLEQGLPKKDLEIRFYAPYLLEGLHALKNETLQFFVINAQRPIIFKESTEERTVTYLVMPVSHSK
ncbi:MAG: polymerase III subunit beta protein [candidate division TM6 bacterium GW2011_GWF2_43_17]|nr:MAG: polymerase III subunit beta protein [candidate division TM6 bacterium GW2011_GWF2_43_17]HAU30408.1 DNA polymerase III subunit beta [Candidatus Dependentiae bacterium]